MKKHYFKGILILLFLMTVAALTISPAVTCGTDSSDAAPVVTYEELFRESLRLHILADNDTKEAQAVKLVVRDALLPYFQALTLPAASKEEAKELLAAHLHELSALANAVLAERGLDYTASVSLTASYFPLRIYGSQTFLSPNCILFPPGIYDTIRIQLGRGEGHNWWCLAYPALCLIDASYEYIPTDSAAYDSVFSTLPEAALKKLFCPGFFAPEPSSDRESTVNILLQSRLLQWLKQQFR